MAEYLFKRRNPWSETSLEGGSLRVVHVAPLFEAEIRASSTFDVGYLVMSMEPMVLQTFRALRSEWNLEGSLEVTGINWACDEQILSVDGPNAALLSLSILTSS